MRDDETDERERTDEKRRREKPPELATKPDPTMFDDEPKSGTFRIPRI